MELSKTFKINSDYKDQRATLDWQMVQFADALFIDKTRSASAPVVYRLNEAKLSLEDALSMSKASSHFYATDAFELMGEATEIDRKQKRIILANKNSVSYTYLVVLSGTKPSNTPLDHELVAALQALNDALKMKPKIPSSFASNKKSPFSAPGKAPGIHPEACNDDEKPDEEKHQDIQLSRFIHTPSNNELSNTLGGYKDRFFEVQL